MTTQCETPKVLGCRKEKVQVGVGREGSHETASTAVVPHGYRGYASVFRRDRFKVIRRLSGIDFAVEQVLDRLYLVVLSTGKE